MPKTLGSSAAASAPGWLQAAVEGVAEETDLPMSLPSKQALMKVSWASLAVRGEYAVELVWALGHTTGGAPPTASVELAPTASVELAPSDELGAGRLGTPWVPPSYPAQSAADHRSVWPSYPLFQPLQHVFPDHLFPGSQDQLFPGSWYQLPPVL